MCFQNTKAIPTPKCHHSSFPSFSVSFRHLDHTVHLLVFSSLLTSNLWKDSTVYKPTQPRVCMDWALDQWSCIWSLLRCMWDNERSASDGRSQMACLHWGQAPRRGRSTTPLESIAGPALTGKKPTTIYSMPSLTVCCQYSLGEFSQDSLGDFLSSAKEASHLRSALVEEKEAGISGRKDLHIKTVVTGPSRDLHTQSQFISRVANLTLWRQYCGAGLSSALQQGPVSFPTPFIHGQDCSITTQVFTFSFHPKLPHSFCSLQPAKSRWLCLHLSNVCPGGCGGYATELSACRVTHLFPLIIMSHWRKVLSENAPPLCSSYTSVY